MFSKSRKNRPQPADATKAKKANWFHRLTSAVCFGCLACSVKDDTECPVDIQQAPLRDKNEVPNEHCATKSKPAAGKTALRNSSLPKRYRVERSPSTKSLLLSEDSLSDDATWRLKYSLGLLPDPSDLPSEQLTPQHSLGINQVNLQVDASSSVAADQPLTFSTVTNPTFEERTTPRTASDSSKSGYLPLSTPGAPGAKTTAGRPVLNSAQREHTAIKSDVDQTLLIKPAVAPDSSQNVAIPAADAPCMRETDAIRAVMHSVGAEPVSTKEHSDGVEPVSTKEHSVGAEAVPTKELKTPQSAALASPGPLAEPGAARKEAFAPQQIGETHTAQTEYPLSGMWGDEGSRGYYEDVPYLGDWLDNDVRVDLYAMFDGHAGISCARMACKIVTNLLRRVLEPSGSPSADLDYALWKTEKTLHQRYLSQLSPDLSGTTATLVLQKQDELHCANLGDCRAVLGRWVNGKADAVALTKDHTPELELAEGRLTKYQIMDVVDVSYLIAEGNHHHMVAASRALGSFGMPGLKRLSRSGAWKGPLIATPEHTSHTITEEDELLVVASKGLWNVMSNEEAVQMAREHMKRNTVDIYGTRDATAKKLVQVAKQRGSWDNVSVLVVQLAALHASAAGPDTSPAHLELCIEPEVGAAAVQLPAGFPEGWICPKKWTITGPHNIGS